MKTFFKHSVWVWIFNYEKVLCNTNILGLFGFWKISDSNSLPAFILLKGGSKRWSGSQKLSELYQSEFFVPYLHILPLQSDCCRFLWRGYWIPLKVLLYSCSKQKVWINNSLLWHICRKCPSLQSHKASSLCFYTHGFCKATALIQSAAPWLKIFVSKHFLPSGTHPCNCAMNQNVTKLH